MQTTIMIGLGELGSLFATGLLKTGHTLVPVRRTDNMQAIADRYTKPKAVWICVAEKDLPNVLQTLPDNWRDLCVLIQNELLPQDWEQHHLINPTIISVWFEKKAGKLPQVVLPSIVYGPQHQQVEAAYTAIQLPIRRITTRDDLLFELVLKNLYIQTTNIAGLVVGGNTQQLIEQHSHVMQAVAHDIITLQQAMTQRTFDQTTLMNGLITACLGDPLHQCMGRSATARLARALNASDTHQLASPSLRDIAAQLANEQ